MNQFREWLSDNLRYILLIIGVVAVLLALFFGVRAITRGFSEDNANLVETADTETSSAAESLVSQPETASAESAAETATEHSALAENANVEVTALISNYYEAVERQDLTALEQLVDTLPEAEAARISSSRTEYSDVKVYTKKGLTAASEIVYAYYHYKNENQPQALPGLSRMLVKKDADSKWKVVYEDLDEATAAYIEEVSADADVQELIAKVKAEYDAEVKAIDEAYAADAEKQAASDTEAAESSASEAEQPNDPSAVDTSESEEAENAEEAASGEASEEETSEEEAAEEEEQEEEYEEPEEEWSSTIVSACNVRSGPGYEYGIIGGLPAGSAVTVIGGEDKGWWHVRTDYLDGYVGRRFING